MIILEKFAVITFYSTHFALKSEKILQNLNYDFKLIPIPREISSNCGLAVKIKTQEKDEIEDILKNHNVEIENIHNMT